MLRDRPPTPSPLTVMYDGACPLCRREIALYRGLEPEQPVCFADISDTSTSLPPTLAQVPRAQLLARLHVRTADGRLVSGAAAFLALWAVLPGWRWLARLGGLPGMGRLLEFAYVGFLRLRPWLQRWATRLERRGSTR